MWLVLGAAVLAACGGDDDSGASSGQEDAGDAASVELVTFNAGLARGFVDLAEERVDAVADAVAGLDADVVALQEVWEPADVALVQEAADAAGYESVTFLDPAPETSGEPACPAGELDELEPCVRTRCADVPVGELAACVLAECGAEYGGVCESCQSCLAANVGQSIDTVVTTCEAGAALYAYGGSFGIGLLSRLPVLEEEHLVFDSSLNRRAVLYAELDAGEGQSLHVFATHLSAVFTDIPYPGDGTWEEEQADQIRRLLALVDERVPEGEPVALLGDLNTGPPAGDLPGEVADNFRLLTDAGFSSAYLDGADPACTYCADHPLVSDEVSSVVIDHILVRGLDSAGSAASRTLDAGITVEQDGERVDTALSDHYGLTTTLRL